MFVKTDDEFNASIAPEEIPAGGVKAPNEMANDPGVEVFVVVTVA